VVLNANLPDSKPLGTSEGPNEFDRLFYLNIKKQTLWCFHLAAGITWRSYGMQTTVPPRARATHTSQLLRQTLTWRQKPLCGVPIPSLVARMPCAKPSLTRQSRPSGMRKQQRPSDTRRANKHKFCQVQYSFGIWSLGSVQVPIYPLRFGTFVCRRGIFYRHRYALSVHVFCSCTSFQQFLKFFLTVALRVVCLATFTHGSLFTL
jgi:hypothetical protein